MPALTSASLTAPTHPAWWLLLGLLLTLLVLLWLRRRSEASRHLDALRAREEQLRLALWASNEFYWDYDVASDALHVLAPEDHVTGGHDFSSVHMANLAEHVHPDDLARVQTSMREYLSGRASHFQTELRVRQANQWHWVHARGRATIRQPDGRVQQLAGIARDITTLHHHERERLVAREAMRVMNEAVAVLDEQLRFVWVNPAFVRVTGYDASGIIGKDAALLDSDQHEPAFYKKMRKLLLRAGSWRGEMWQRRSDGRDFLCALECTHLHEPGTDRRLYVAVLSNITERRRTEEELRRLANYDTLTGLPNRSLLGERLAHAVVRARREQRRLAVLFLDLDHFKDINDSLGHATGDSLLRAAAQRLQETLPGHAVGRQGGDEFTVILEDIGDAAEAETAAQRLLAAFDMPLRLDETRQVTMSPSIGISVFPDHAQIPSDLLKYADAAMYQAKAAGRRTAVRYTEAMDTQLRRRAALMASLRKVLERNELDLVYQPFLSLHDGRITRVEALLRWHSPEHGEVPPAEFVPLAEESGLIVPIGEWVLARACRTLARWQARGLTDMCMAVNVSALQFLRSDLAAAVERTLRSEVVTAPHLELEITESVLMASPEEAAERLRPLRGLGVSLAVDDFGTGYSSLAYLRRLPITTLKIDKTFIDGLGEQGGHEDEVIASTIIAMGQSLGLSVVAEGVETRAQFEFLRERGCDLVQGHWLARPMPAEACMQFILAHRDAASFAPP